jgi:hypothetical protein
VIDAKQEVWDAINDPAWDSLKHPEVRKMLTTLAQKVIDTHPSVHDAADLWMQTAEAIALGKFGDVESRVESVPGILYGDFREFMVDFVKYQAKHHRENESYELRYFESGLEW